VKKKDTASEQLSTTLSSSAHTKIDSLAHTMDNYPTANSVLIKTLNLQRHPENGYFVETDRQPAQVPSPFADNKLRSLSTSIYYLLTHDEPQGVFLMVGSFTYHVHHQGRAEYTLITPVPGGPPKIEVKVMGTGAGEHRQLLVGAGIWKKSRILPEDIELAKSEQDKDRIGCLITEVVVTGFHWEDHKFMKKQDLEELFKGAPGAEERIAEYEKFLLKD